jgi:hypothetical protein
LRHSYRRCDIVNLDRDPRLHVQNPVKLVEGDNGIVYRVGFFLVADSNAAFQFRVERVPPDGVVRPVKHNVCTVGDDDVRHDFVEVWGILKGEKVDASGDREGRIFNSKANKWGPIKKKVPKEAVGCSLCSIDEDVHLNAM